MCVVNGLDEHLYALLNEKFGSDRVEARSRLGSSMGASSLIRVVATMAGVLFAPMAASAGIVTINFPTDVVSSDPTGHSNATADGFRLSPSAEYTLVPGGGLPSTIDRGIGWDSDGPANPSYLGALKVSTASLYFDDGGVPFSLHDVRFTAAGLDKDFKLVSSNGGTFDIPAGLVGPLDASFASPQWTDITWLTFGYFDAGAPTAGIERMVVSVDEPAPLAAFAIGLLILSVLRRTKTRLRRTR